MLLEPRPCLFCMNPATSRIALDKRGRPWIHCGACGTRAFLQSFSPALNGVAVLTPYLLVALDEMKTREGYDLHARRIGAFLDGIHAQRQGLHAPSPSPVVATPGVVLRVSAPPFARTA